MDWTQKIKTILVSSIVPGCALPALALNVWPRIENMLVSGVTSQELGIVLLVSISALGMTSVPFAMAKSPNKGFWWFCLVFGLALGILNYMMAVGAIGKAHDGNISGVLDRQDRKARLEHQRSELERRKSALGNFTFTTADMLSSADVAVKLATEARDQECGKVGDFCRARQAQLATRQEERAQLAASRAITERAESLDNRIAGYQNDLNSLGYVPAIADPQAARISRAVGIFVDLGPEAHIRIADYIISFLAIFAEALALGMPRIIFTALQRPPEVWAGSPPARALAATPPKTIAYKPPPALAPATAPATPTLPPPSKKKLKHGDPLAWHAIGLSKSKDRLRTWDAYISYKKWCKTIEVAPADFPTFDTAIRSTGIMIATDQNRTFYLNSSLVTNDSKPNLRLVC